MKNKNTLIWVGVASAVLIGGGIFWWMQSRKKQQALKKKLEEEQQKKMEEENKPVTPTPAPSYTPAPTFTFPFKTTQEGNTFRAWINDTYPEYAKEIKLDRQGALNNFVQKAWDKYGAEFLKRDEKKDDKSSSKLEDKLKAGENLYISGSGIPLFTYPSFDKMDNGGYKYGLVFVKKDDFLENPYAKFTKKINSKFSEVFFTPYNAKNYKSFTIKSLIEKYPSGTKVYIQNTDLKDTQF